MPAFSGVHGALGCIPTEIGQLTALVNLQLEVNWLTGSHIIHACLTCVAYRVMCVWVRTSACCSTGRIPTEIGQLTALTRLSLQWSKLTGVPSFAKRL